MDYTESSENVMKLYQEYLQLDLDKKIEFRNLISRNTQVSDLSSVHTPSRLEIEAVLAEDID
jgi:hypothetical protein